uniref:C2H2-type domain-containing protein n=1 Tax=Poecilia latipinna TaxID=48699 RepID=A0A3B3VHE2_9TELE
MFELNYSVSADEDQLVVKQETDSITVTSTNELKDGSEAEPNKNQLLYANGLEAEDPHQQGNNQKDSESRDTNLEPKARKLRGKHCRMLPYLPVDMESHSYEQAYSCKFCHKSFRHSSSLTRHRIIHRGEKPYSCDMCDKSFRYIGNHYSTHTGQKPYSCDTCNKSFRHNFCDLSETLTDEKVYQCDTCDKLFKTQTNLKDHYVAHTGEKPYSCDSCNKSFRHCSSLARHRRIHDEDKLYSCEICDKSFITKTILKNHYKIHMRKKLCPCDICDESFMSETILMDHYGTHN